MKNLLSFTAGFFACCMSLPALTSASITRNKMKTPVKLLLAMLLLTLPTLLWAAKDHDHSNTEAPAAHAGETAGSEHGHGHEEEQNSVHLSAEQIQAAAITVEPLQARPLAIEIPAPGEIRLNAYATSQVTPRIEAQVVKRMARLGDQVEKGQALVRLSSAAMAQAQGTALVASKDWQRISKLGVKVVSEQRYLEAKVAWQQAQARLLAYGMTSSQIHDLIKNTSVSQADGSFTLLSPQNGTIIQDDFILGQMVQPGDLLYEITDESSIWVEAQINPREMRQIHVGAIARLRFNNHWVQGKVIQIHHKLDETTRTMGVRIEIPNPDDHMHPGQFVQVLIQSSQQSQPVLSLPLDAVLRSPDGDWQVFVEKASGEFAPVEVELLRQLPGIAVIDGLPAGTPVVTHGAFFVQAEMSKSGFAVHNH